ncbi:MAG: peptidase M50 [Deltaproteobacteria bacterium HGW-Deltaproteobacteria-6]|nr:MAG: peptidase M50 [Deltaproteobacteria bacterium HGW-Deltaproteobacteria-6]
MEKTLFSNSWYRVADLRPFVRRHTEIHRHAYRGKVWYILQDHANGRFHRFSEESYLLIGLMDGKRSLQEIWEAACEKLADDMPTQDEVIALLSQLNKADLLQSDISPDMASLNQRSRKDRKTKLMNRIRSPLALRVPLLDPDRFLEKTKSITAPFFTLPALIIWLTVVLTASVLAFVHWDELTTNLADRVLSLENLFIFWLIYPVIKALHEFGHAYAVKKWGGEIHEMGIIFLVFMPIPYVDASAASAFREKGKRIAVGAAGIAVELFIASLAMFLWLNVEAGAVRAAAYNVMLVAGVSTLLFNGNPLLKFDSYYVLSDFLEIPNLGTRSNRYLGYLASRYLAGNDHTEFHLSDAGEGRWLVFYGIASFLYRIFITLQIALFVAGRFFFIGILIAIWALIGLLIVPFVRVIRTVVKDHALYKKRGRILAVGFAAASLIILFVAVIPFPMYTVVEGIVWPAEQARLHAGVDGTIKDVVARPGAMVKAGDPLIQCENKDLISRVELLQAALRGSQARIRWARVNDRTRERIALEENNRIGRELSEAREQAALLTIRSPIDGEFIIPRADDLSGRYLKRGEPIGHVVDYSRTTVRVVVQLSDVDQVRTNVRSVKARPAENLSLIIPAELIREIPAASSDLPSLALSLKGGGAIALDPREPGKPKSFENLFQFDVRLLGPTPGKVGERIYVRFEHHPETLLSRWYRKLLNIFLKRFNI